MSATISLEDIEAAAARIASVAYRTPLLENEQLNARVGGRVFIKPECLQRTGSFKIRGAYNRISQMSDAEKARGVVAFSSGNHGQGVACAAKLLGVRATIVMPSDAPAVKLKNTRDFGAKIILYDRFTESREAIAQAIAAKEGATVVPSFDDRDIIAGQGTVGLEIIEELTARSIALDVAVFSCGGGGLSAGSAIAINARSPKTALHIVEPQDFDDTARSLASGKLERNSADARSICDALLSPSPGALTLPILRAHGVRASSISDREAKAAVRFAARELKLMLEPSGAAALAALLAGKIEAGGKTIVIVCSGGNIDPKTLATILAE